MSSDPFLSGFGRADLDPSDDLFIDPRKAREDKAIADIEARLESGALDPIAADREILELALARFSFLDKGAIEELRAAGLLLNEEPEMVESRTLLAKPDPKDIS